MLTKFKLVNHEKLKGLFFKGSFIAFDRIDDTLAEQLMGKTHVLERLAEVPAATAAPQLAEAQEAPARRLKANS